MSAYENVIALSKGSADALVASTKATVTGTQEIATTYAALVKANADRAVAAVNSLTAARTPEAAFEVHSAYVREALDSAIADGKTLMDLTSKVFGEVTAPLAAQVNTVLDWQPKAA